MSAPLVVERVTIGPQGTFAKVPGLDVGYRLLTKVFPLGRGKIVEREGKVFVSTPPGRQSRRGIAYPPCVQALMALSNLYERPRLSKYARSESPLRGVQAVGAVSREQCAPKGANVDCCD